MMEGEVAFLVSSIRLLNSRADSEDLPDTIVELVGQRLEAQHVLVVAVEDQTYDPLAYSDAWRRQRAEQFYSLDVIRRAAASATGYFCGLIEHDPSPSQLMYNILSCVSARVEMAGKTIGLLYADLRSGARRFSDQDGAALKSVGDLCAPYLGRYLESRRKPENTQSAESVDMDAMLTGASEPIQNLKAQIREIATLEAPVLIRGETGTGKEIVATLLHRMSKRAARKLVVLDCAALPRNLFESELFGYEKGAFTGAEKRREGRVWSAQGSTLFLDEIGDVPLEIQTALLRLIQFREYHRIGSDVPVGPVDVRFLFATNRDLEKMMKEGTLRDDFYYRIMRGQILRVPNLAERVADVPPLAAQFARPKQVSKEACALLQATRWKGNVRELQSVVEAVAARCKQDTIDHYSIRDELYLRGLEQNQPSAAISPAEELRRDFKGGKLTWKQLDSYLANYYAQFGSWSKVARHLGCSTPDQVKAFQQWVWKLQQSGVLAKKAESESD